MSDPATTDQTPRSLRRLSIAVWILAIIVVVNLVVSILALISPAFLSKRIMEIVPKQLADSEGLTIEELNSFRSWPLERQIEKSSVIALAKYEQSGSTLKCVIAEILKQAPNTKFYYKVGDEYGRDTRQIRDGTNYGDGEIIFFTGSPASFQYSCSYKGDRITALGDVPIAELRELTRKAAP